MRAEMGKDIFQSFYSNTILGYSKAIQKKIVKQLENENVITFVEQKTLFDRSDVIYVQSKNDFSEAIIKVLENESNYKIFEIFEFTKAYKYSVPLFIDKLEKEDIEEKLEKLGCMQVSKKDYMPSGSIAGKIDEDIPTYLEDGESNIMIKFVLQKRTSGEAFDEIDYRYSVIMYVDFVNNIIDIRYDSIRPNFMKQTNQYEDLVSSCVEWLKQKLEISLYLVESTDIVEIINKPENDEVKMYKQMMELGRGGAAELTCSEYDNYVMPFIGEIKEIIIEHEALFEEANEIKKILTEYLEEKESNTHYPYIYLKFIESVSSRDYILKITFDYLLNKYTLLQHLGANGNHNLGMERMNNAIEYLCRSNSFTKGSKL